jgi:Fe-S cluster assembly iron-binding protein IscA
MALDEPKDYDEIFEIDGFTYLIDKQLLEEVRPVTVDFRSIGFTITGKTANSSSRCGC